jgi:hypothetical protein
VGSGGNLILADKAVIRGHYSSYGGGVCFAKTGESVIYGKNKNDEVDDDSNKVAASDGSGDAVCVGTLDASGVDVAIKKRDRTVGAGDNLSYDGSGTATGNWDK